MEPDKKDELPKKKKKIRLVPRNLKVAEKVV